MRFSRKISVVIVALLCMGNLYFGMPAYAVSSKATSEATIKVPKKQKKAYVKLLKKAKLAKSIKVK